CAASRSRAGRRPSSVGPRATAASSPISTEAPRRATEYDRHADRARRRFAAQPPPWQRDKTCASDRVRGGSDMAGTTTELLQRWRAGEADALDDLLPQVY